MAMRQEFTFKGTKRAGFRAVDMDLHRNYMEWNDMERKGGVYHKRCKVNRLD